MKKYCIGYLAEGEIVPYFNEITAHISAKFDIWNISKRVPPHLTLKYPFEAEDTSEIESRIEAVAKDMTPVPFTLNRFGRFEEGGKTIFLTTSASEELISSIKDCILKLGEFDEDRKFSIDEYKIHLSITRKLDPEISNTVWKYLQTLPSPYIDMVFNNITLFEFRDDVWEVKRTFRNSNNKHDL